MAKKAPRKVSDSKRSKQPVPYAQRMKWFLHDRFGMFVHWGLYSIPARGEWIRNIESIPVAKYEPYFEEFNPRRYDPRKWAALAKATGQKYVVLTTKHHDGFCLFDSKLTDYKATNTPAGRDLIAEYVQALRDEGIKVGFYYSLIDWHHPHYPVKGDRFHPMRNNPEVCAEKRDMSKYVEYLHGQVRELLTNYGKIDVIWFDFSYGEMSGEVWKANELVEMVRSLQPGILMDNRLIAGHENMGQAQLGDFASPEQVIPPEGVTDAAGSAVPWEACITLNDHWGYARDDHEYKNPAQVVHMLVECVAKGGNLLLNVGPTALGEIPAESVEILERVGQWMDYNGASIYGCGRCRLPKPEWGYYTQNGRTIYAHLLKKPVGPIAILGLCKQVVKARLLADGSEVVLSRPWNIGTTREDAIFMNLPGSQLVDPLDTVVALELNEDF